MPSKRRRARRDRKNNGGPSPAWIGSAVLLGLVAMALVIVLIHAATSPKPATPAAASPPGASPGAAPPPGTATAGAPAPVTGGQEGRPAGCSTTGSDQTVPTSPPAGVNWALVHGVAVPSSPGDGPTLHDTAGVGYCYSHTPLGALLAASNLGQGTGDSAGGAGLGAGAFGRTE